MNLYFNQEKLIELEKEIKTIPIDGNDQPLAVEYDEHFVRDTVIKLIADRKLMEEYIATVIQNYSHVLSYDLTQKGLTLFK